MRRLLSLFMVLGLMVGPVATAEAKKTTESDQTALPKIVASDGMPSDRFGVSVAVSGDTALVGAPVEDAERGAAYVFTRTAGGWMEQAKLIASDGRSLRKFGFSVALSGDTAVVGGSTAVVRGNDNHADRTPGAAYVFERVGDTWIEQAKLTAPTPDGAAGDDFGSSVAVSGETVVVGARGIGVGGAAYVFVRAGGAWLLQAKLAADDTAGGDNFGFSVAVSGDTAVVGARFADVGSSRDQGSAYVFARDGVRWSQEANLAGSNGAGGDSFGFAVGASAETVVVGAVNDDVNANENQGSAYVFARAGGAWPERAYLTADDGASGDEFGSSVAVSGDTVVLGAQRDTTGGNSQHGSAYVFGRSGGAWPERTKLIASDGGSSDLFGVSVAISGGTAVIGAAFHNLHRGAVYVWEDPTTCPRRCGLRSASSPATTSVLPAVR